MADEPQEVTAQPTQRAPTYGDVVALTVAIMLRKKHPMLEAGVQVVYRWAPTWHYTAKKSRAGVRVEWSTEFNDPDFAKTVDRCAQSVLQIKRGETQAVRVNGQRVDHV